MNLIQQIMLFSMCSDSQLIIIGIKKMLFLTTLNKKANVVLVKPRFSFCKSQQVISKVLTPNSFFLVMHEQKIWLNRFCQTKFACLAVGNFIFYFILELINVKC